jgi:RNA polymerase sigma-B factor
VSSEFEVQVTEEFEVAQATAETVRIEHSSPDRARARELFERLAVLPPDDPERARIRGYLVELHLPLVEYLARRFRNRGEWLDDLTQVATIGLIKSIDRFDLERGVEFSTYATPTIVGEIKRHFRDKGWAVRVPRRLQELKLSLTKAIGDLAQREGRAPTVSELAAHLQMSEEEVLEGLESANAYSTVSLDAPDSGDEDAPAVADSLGMVDDALEGVEYRESLKPLLEQLPPREKKILLLRFFGNMTQSQIAAELGISQMHVSRLLARTLTQLREGLTTDELPGGPVEGAEAGGGEQGGQAAGREQQHGHAPFGAVGAQQVDPPDTDGQLCHDYRGPGPRLRPGQARGEGGEQGGHADGDQRQRDATGPLVGLPDRGRVRRKGGRHAHAGGLDGLHGGGQAERARGYPGRGGLGRGGLAGTLRRGGSCGLAGALGLPGAGRLGRSRRHVVTPIRDPGVAQVSSLGGG